MVFSVINDKQTADRLQNARQKLFKAIHGRALKTGREMTLSPSVLSNPETSLTGGGEILTVANLGPLSHDTAASSTCGAAAVLVSLDRQMQRLIAVFEPEPGDFYAHQAWYYVQELQMANRLLLLPMNANLHRE